MARRNLPASLLRASHAHSHPSFAFFPKDFQTKGRVIAICGGHLYQQCLAAPVQSKSLKRNDLVNGMFHAFSATLFTNLPLSFCFTSRTRPREPFFFASTKEIAFSHITIQLPARDYDVLLIVSCFQILTY